MEAVARKILNSAREMVPGRFEVRAATRETHPYVAWKSYERMRGELERLGFRLLGDVEVLSYATPVSMSRPAVLRLFVSGDGMVTAGFYRMSLRWTAAGLLARVFGGGKGMLDLSTGFDSGAVVETSTAPLSGKWISPPFLLRQFRPGATPQALLARHLERVAEHHARNPAASPVHVASLEQLVALADRVERRKREFRQALGWITREELANHGAGSNLEPLMAAIQRLLAEEAAAGPPPAPAPRPPAAPPPTVAGIDPVQVKADSERVLSEAGIGINPHLSWIEPGEPRAVGEVAGRALVMTALINLHFNAPVPVVKRWIEANGVDRYLSVRERALLEKTGGEPTEQEKTDLYWYIEALWALLWAGGVAEGLRWDQRVPDHLATLVPSLRANDDGSRLRERMRLRPHAALFRMLDLHYRLHWYARDGELNGYPTPGVSQDVIMERRKALEWLLHPGADWDDVDLST